VRKVAYFCFMIVLLIFLVACEKVVHTKKNVDCNSVEPPNTLNSTVPEWEIRPNMLLYEAKQNKPLSIVSYEVILKNLGTEAARNIHVYIGNQLFGWERMNFDSKSELACSELQTNQFNIWVWSHGRDTHLDPSWRSTMEQTAQLRFVWEDSKGWHQVQGHLPNQYYSQSFMATDLSPLSE
jgi:hypothetical protein